MRVLVTGGSSGIGLAVAEQLGDRGAQSVLLARGHGGLAEAAARVRGHPGTITADVGNADETVAAIDEAAEILGGLDVVVAAAGLGTFGPFVEMGAEDHELTIRTTLIGAINTAHAALPHLERTRGTLVVVGSVAGRVPAPWLSAYAAAKHGVRGFIRSLDCELRALGTPVSLALVAPGPVNTPFWRRARTPDRRLPPEIFGAYRPEDVAAEVLRAIDSPRATERTVGGLMAVAEMIDAVVPNLTLPILGRLARVAWRNREEREESTDDALSQPTTEAHRGGGLADRPSALQRARSAAGSQQ